LRKTIYSVLVGHDVVRLGNLNLLFVRQWGVFNFICWTLTVTTLWKSWKNGIPQLHHYKNLTT